MLVENFKLKLFGSFQLFCLAIVLLTVCQTACTTHPKESNSDLLTNAINAYKFKNYDLAISYATKLIQLDNEYRYTVWADAYHVKRKSGGAVTNETAIQYAHACGVRGHAYLDKANYEKAASDFSEAIKFEPGDFNLYKSRATAYMRLHDQAAALMDFSMVIFLLADLPDQKLSLAQAYDDRGNLYYLKNKAKCIDDFNRAVELNPTSDKYYADRGRSHLPKSDFSGALKDYDKAIQLNPTNAQAYMLRGIVYVLQHNYTNGIADFTKSIRINPGDWFGYNTLAVTLVMCRDDKIRDGQKALKIAKKACDLTAWTNSVPIGTLASAYAETGNFSEAVKWQKKVLEWESAAPYPASQTNLFLYEHNETLQAAEKKP